MNQPRQTVFIVDDDDAVRKALTILLDSAGIQSASYVTAAEFLEDYAPDRSGCLLLDVNMPGMSGTDVQSELAAKHSILPIIFLTGHGDIPLAVRAMEGGAFYFFEKPANDDELLDRIRAALERDARNHAELAECTVILERAARLTPREREIMRLVVQGLPNKGIAHELGISERTVEVHRARVMGKMRADSLPHLVRMDMQIRNQPLQARRE